MDHETTTELTTALEEMVAGKTAAKEKVFRLVYDELHAIAESLMHRERSGHTMQPTALVNEAYVKLATGKTLRSASNRAYFFSAAAAAMRQVLVDHARKRATAKRGGSPRAECLDEMLIALREVQGVEILDLNQALEQLAQFHQRQHDVIMLRFFAGLDNREIAQQLQVSISAVEKDFRIARAWLHNQLREKQE